MSMNNCFSVSFHVSNRTYMYYPISNFFCELENEFVEKHDNTIFSKITGSDKLSIYLDNILAEESDLPSIISYYTEHVLPRKLILEITEDCNLRCKYCFNTIGDSPRIHSSLKMSIDDAIKAIDYYFDLYSKCFIRIPKNEIERYLKIAPPNLNWWGGEPFLNFELLKKTFYYFIELPWEDFGISKDKLAFSVVTNLTYLPKEILDFIVEHKIFLMVSLDGNESEHNLYRQFKDGTGSFIHVMKNIDILLKDYPLFCKNRLIIQAVYMDGHVLAIDKKSFFRQYFYDEEGKCKILKVTQYPQKTREQFVSSNWIKLNSNVNVDIVNFKNKIKNLINLSEDELFDFLQINESINEEFKDVLLLEEKIDFSEPINSFIYRKIFSCPVGKDVIYLSAKGEYHICNRTDSSFSIGNLNEGINSDKVGKLLSNYLQVLRSSCKSCWAIRLCSMCPANVLVNAHFRAPNEQECDFIRTTIKRNFYKLIILHENQNLLCKIRNIYYKKLSFLDYSHPIFIK